MISRNKVVGTCIFFIGAAQQKKGVDLPSIKNQLNFRHTAADAEKKYEDWERRVGQLEDFVYSYFLLENVK